MKAYKINKKEYRVPVFITSLPDPLPKPKLPLKLFMNIHKPEVYIEFEFEESFD